MQLTFIRAYPISTLIQVLGDEKIKKAIDAYLKECGFSNVQRDKIKNTLHTITYLKEHFESTVSGSKPLATMADKHKSLVVDFYMELLKINAAHANFQMLKEFNEMANQLSIAAEAVEESKKASDPRVIEKASAPEDTNA